MKDNQIYQKGVEIAVKQWRILDQLGIGGNYRSGQGVDIGPISCNYDQPSFFFEDEYCVSRE